MTLKDIFYNYFPVPETDLSGEKEGRIGNSVAWGEDVQANFSLTALLSILYF